MVCVSYLVGVIIKFHLNEAGTSEGQLSLTPPLKQHPTSCALGALRAPQRRSGGSAEEHPGSGGTTTDGGFQDFYFSSFRIST